MMQNTFFYIIVHGLLMIFSASIYGQKTFEMDPVRVTVIDTSLIECFYDYSIKAQSREDSVGKPVLVKYNTLLQANANVSKFWDWHAFKLDSLRSIPEEQLSPADKRLLHNRLTSGSVYFLKNVMYLYIPVIFSNYPKNKFTVIDDLGFEYFLYEYPKTTLNWCLEEDTMTICGYLCNKAKTTFAGREWIAWYAPEIAISGGPWKLYGLPGLILKAVDGTDEHCFEAIGIRNAFHPIYLTKDYRRRIINKEKFLNQKIPFDKNPTDYLNSIPSELDYVIFNKSVLFINGHHSSILINVMYSPLELEQ